MGLALVCTSSWCYQVVKLCLPFSFISLITFEISIHLAAADYIFIAFTCYACLYSGVSGLFNNNIHKTQLLNSSKIV